MKKVLLLSAVLVALAAPAVHAQGLNLAWGDCGGAANLVDACTSQTGAFTLVPSVVTPAVPNFVGVEMVLDVQVDAAALPAWWGYQAGGCRQNKMVSSFDFTGGPFTCADPWGGLAFGGLQFQPDAINPARGRIKCAAAVAVGVALGAGDENYMAKISILKSAPNTACVGCSTPACIVFNSALLAQPAGQGDFLVSAPATSQHVTWQGGGTLECPGATPTQSNSWGQIKAMYR